ncbi:Pentatricopeptide repeat-containing protein, mitochondrial [Heracleum sosnowskyi]|uniref:Pentatricopeptide repeat-containing protein, mitochondrial n=1 Tax=Heracleum sosnowskyi TaxID=360622 RepID=A0AAD8HSD2_9APIA|nr:Pentatricopeptide repeat-containing protein, mitochondrial [Heracleum sosnowskyi]
MRHIATYRALLPQKLDLFHQQKGLFATHQSPQLTTIELLLKICLQHCKNLQTRVVFDEIPQRVKNSLQVCKLVHSQSLKLGFGLEGKLGNALVSLYAKCGNLEFADKAFSRLLERDTLAWNSILSMYSKRGMVEDVLWCFGSMRNCGVVPNQFTFAIVFSGCGRVVNVKLGRQVHCDVIKMGYEVSHFCEGSLIDMYAKCGCVVDARSVFDAAVDPDTVSWTAMISGYVQSGYPDEALSVFDDMQKLGREPDQVVFGTIINACMSLGRLDEARRLFSEMPSPSDISWNVMISGHAQRGYEVEAVRYFRNMTNSGIKPTRSTFGSVLSAIANLSNLDYGMQVHPLATKLGLDSNVYVGSSMLNMYAKCRKMEAAREIFDALDEKNIVMWNAMLGGYVQNGYVYEVVELFTEMRNSGFEADEYSYTSILSACAALKNIRMGRQLHSLIIKNKFGSKLYAGNALVDMYAKSSALNDARKQFDLIRNRDHVSWNAIIVGYVQNEEEEDAFNLFRKMRSEGVPPDEASLASILSACSNIQSCEKGIQVHCSLIKYGLETSLFAGSSLIDMYVKCGDTGAAHKVYSRMTERSVVSINALIAGYSQTNIEEAVHILKSMLDRELRPSEVTFACLLDGCNGPSKLHFGKQLHSAIIKVGLPYEDEYLSVSLLGMYLNSQEKEDAALLFSELPSPKSTVLWTVAISGHTQNDCCEEAILLFYEMRHHNSMPDQATFVSVLKACAVSASLSNGGEVHCLVFRTGFDSDESTCSALVDMYAKCGDITSSAQVFGEMLNKRDVISWNSMIVGFAKNGHAENALKTFCEMKQANIKPDEVTFLGVLGACSHAGWVSEGRRIFDTMTGYYKIKPRVDHCACMIDLLGRSGLLEEAEALIDKLEFQHEPMIWAAYLGSCKLHGDDIRGKLAAEKLFELEPQSSSPYVLLSNIYAASGNWDAVNLVRREMKEKQVIKFPGCSWIVLGNKTNLFVAGDDSHPDSDDIREFLKDLTASMKDDSYVAECKSCIQIEG